ncbi:MAG: hypothetical protein HC767_00250 [Akkermansiaceae bacterium]|nr:hypothetical protein [Akkermansiaceae bacterium]
MPSKASSAPAPVDGAPADAEAGNQGRSTVHRRNGSFTSGGRDRRGSVPKLQPPLPVSPRVDSLLNNTLNTTRTACSDVPGLLPDVGAGMGMTQPQVAATSTQPPGKPGDARIAQRAASTPAEMSSLEHPGRALRMQQEVLGKFAADTDEV